MDETAEMIRNRMRENTCADRAKSREEKYIEKRDIIRNKKTDLRDENNVIAAALAITNNTSNKMEALKILKDCFIENVANIVTFMKVEGASHALIKHLMSNNSMEQLLALECCCNLSLGDAKTCFKLAKGATPYLINTLQGLNYNLMNVAIITLGNMSGSGKKTCQLLHAQGLIRSLEHTIGIPELREATAKALVLFTKNYLNDLSEEESLSIVQNCLPFYESSTNIQWLIYHFSSLNSIKTLLITDRLPQRIITYLSSLESVRPDNLISVTAQIRTLGSLSTDPDGVTVNILLDDWNTTMYIIKFLMRSNYKHLCKELFWSLANIIRSNSPEVKNKLATKADDLHLVINYIPAM
ncbi:hypothetical protein O3M35_010591 [Rhynocoris fuscipes]|uniref:Uncharacterized protein n=1 Tax=Rhynocoris fuscipes TaxID=488301 RepID=A0AAW1D0G7_9HEMI